MQTYVYRTHYSRHFTIWVKRTVLVLGIGMLVTAWILSDNEGDLWWIAFPILIIVFVLMLLSPVDDLAIADNKLLHLRTSVIAGFSKSDSFDISQMKSIESFRDNAFNDKNKNDTVIQITYIDGTMKRFSVPLLRKHIDECLGEVNRVIHVREK